MDKLGDIRSKMSDGRKNKIYPWIDNKVPFFIFPLILVITTIFSYMLFSDRLKKLEQFKTDNGRDPFTAWKFSNIKNFVTFFYILVGIEVVLTLFLYYKEPVFELETRHGQLIKVLNFFRLGVFLFINFVLLSETTMVNNGFTEKGNCEKILRWLTPALSIGNAIIFNAELFQADRLMKCKAEDNKENLKDKGCFDIKAFPENYVNQLKKSGEDLTDNNIRAYHEEKFKGTPYYDKLSEIFKKYRRQ